VAHAIWSGTINFGLVNIPVKLRSAVSPKDLHFNFLHREDQGRINNVRRCSVCGKEVAWDDLERGYELHKGRYVTLSDDDLKGVNPEATQSVDIVEFVELAEINPMFFDKPYYLEPEKKGRHAYALLREALKDAGKVGIARVVIRSREHLAAVKPNGDALVLELMHFADELIAPSALDLPLSEKPAEGEMKVAKLLIDTMTAKWEPEAFHDSYREQVLEMIEARAEGQAAPKAGKAPVPAATNVVNLMDVLQKSLDATRERRPAAKKAAAAVSKKPARRRPPSAA
jgi:DNA end-binding protein Ku